MKFKDLKISRLVVFIIIILIVVGVFVWFYPEKDVEIKTEIKTDSGFIVDNLFLKISIVENGSAVTNLKIKNIDSSSKGFFIEIRDLEKVISLNPYEFSLESGKEQSVNVIFNTNNMESGVYLGRIVVSSSGEVKEVPIILEVQSDDVLFDSNIKLFPQGKEIKLGDKLNMEMSIFDLSGIGISNIKGSYFIKDFEGKTLIYEVENLVVDGRLDYSKTLDLQEGVGLGDYVLINLVEYKGSIGTSSIYFRVVEEINKTNFEWSWMNLIIVIFVLFFLFFFFYILYSIFYRDRLLKELQNQYKGELRRQREFIDMAEKRNYSKLKSSFEKKEYKKEIKKIKGQRVKAIKEIHKERLKKFKNIKKKGSKFQMGRQIKMWRSKGYDTSVLDKKFKIPKAKDFEKKLKAWKNKGYDTRVLERK